MRTALTAAVAVLTALALALTLTGCTVTITAKNHGWGGYYLCDGTQPLPCRSGYSWRVSQAQYDQAYVGESVPFG
jgi:hypothetical protein